MKLSCKKTKNLMSWALLKNNDMKIAIFGNKTTTLSLINYILENQIMITAIVCLKHDSKNDRTISGYSNDIKDAASKNNIKLVEVDDYSLKSDIDQNKVISLGCDIGLVTGWQRIIPQKILYSFKIGIFGWHGSFLKFPNGRGRSPLNWSIRVGADRIYHNLFKYDHNADTGPVFETKKFPINKEDYIEDIQMKALEHIKTSSIKLIKAATSNNLLLQNQPQGVSISLPKISPCDGELQPKFQTADQALNLIRSTSKPFPGAFIRENKYKIIIWRASTIKLKGKNILCINFTDRPIYSDSYEKKDLD